MARVWGVFVLFLYVLLFKNLRGGEKLIKTYEKNNCNFNGSGSPFGRGGTSFGPDAITKDDPGYPGHQRECHPDRKRG